MIKNKLIWCTYDTTPQLWPKLQPPYADDFTEYREYIVKNVNFTKVLLHYKLRYEACNTSKYTHKMVCPFKFHKNGKERTGSFRFDNKNNTFVCFGCSEFGDALKFMYHIDGHLDDETNLRRLAIIGGLVKDDVLLIPDDYINAEYEAPPEKNYQIKFDTGVILREYLSSIKKNNSYAKECEWADNMLMKIDKYFDVIDDENLDDAKKIYNNLNDSIIKRKKKMVKD